MISILDMLCFPSGANPFRPGEDEIDIESVVAPLRVNRADQKLDSFGQNTKAVIMAERSRGGHANLGRPRWDVEGGAYEAEDDGQLKYLVSAQGATDN